MTQAPTSTAHAPRTYGSEALTQGFRVSVEPLYRHEQSDPAHRKHLWSYQIRIANEGESAARLVSRRWVIVDAAGRSQEIVGEGVIGQQPVIRPGQIHEYASYVPLETPWGTMEGAFTMRTPAGEQFEIRVARFYLVSPRE